MFTKQHEQTSIKEAETIIGPSIKVKGDFHGKGSIVVEGIIEGRLKTGSYLYVGNEARVTADIEAKDAKIGGEVNGNIKVTGYLEITSSARIKGDIEADFISMEKGAILNGQCTMKTGEQDGSDKESVKPPHS